MPQDGNEPQSYGSGEDWVTGDTGAEVNPQKSTPPAEHRHFYEPRQHEESSAPHQGGDTSGVQLAECSSCQEDGSGDANAETQPVTKVTGKTGGAKHDSFFRKRDYDGS